MEKWERRDAKRQPPMQKSGKTLGALYAAAILKRMPKI